jgi:hypothetical protein
MRFAVVPVVLLPLLLPACFNDGAEGKPCMATKDCQAGLVCDNAGGTVEAPTGTCRKPGDVPQRLDAAIVDAAPPRDGARDTAPDAGRPDGPAADRPPADAPASGPDAGDGPRSDGGGSDGGAPDDARHDGAADSRG